MSSGAAQWGQFLALQALVKRLAATGILTVTPAGLALLDDATPGDQLTTLGVSTFIKTLLDDADAAAARTTLSIVTGTWTPTATNVANMSAITPAASYYTRVGDMVMCFGSIGTDPNLSPTASSFRITLPIASNFGAVGDCAGTFGDGAGNNVKGKISADTVNDAALFSFSAGSGTAVTDSFHFSYRII